LLFTLYVVKAGKKLQLQIIFFIKYFVFPLRGLRYRDSEISKYLCLYNWPSSFGGRF